MTAPTLSSALAVPFLFTSLGTGSDINVAFSAGPSPVGVTVPTNYYWMQLAPSSNEFLRVVAAAINSAMAGAGRADVFTVTMGADSRVTISNATPFTMTLGIPLLLMGFTTQPINVTSATATNPPQHFATFIQRVSADWTPKTAVAGGENLAGVGYGVYVGTYREEDDIAFGFIPRDATQRTSLAVNQTPWQPAYGVTLGNHAGLWSCRDILAEAGGEVCHAALGNFQTLLTSTTATYDNVTLPFSEIASPRKDRQREGWDAYFIWTVRLIRQSTQTGTRA